jgi:hypothetical protein
MEVRWRPWKGWTRPRCELAGGEELGKREDRGRRWS